MILTSLLSAACALALVSAAPHNTFSIPHSEEHHSTSQHSLASPNEHSHPLPPETTRAIPPIHRRQHVKRAHNPPGAYANDVFDITDHSLVVFAAKDFKGKYWSYNVTTETAGNCNKVVDMTNNDGQKVPDKTVVSMVLGYGTACWFWEGDQCNGNKGSPNWADYERAMGFRATRSTRSGEGPWAGTKDMTRKLRSFSCEVDGDAYPW